MNAAPAPSSGFFRGVRTFFVGLGIVLAFLVVVGVTVAFAAYHEAKPLMEQTYERPVYHHADTCLGSPPCASAPATSRFEVPAGTREVRAHVDVIVLARGGAARLTVVDAAGHTQYDRTFAATTTAQSSDEWLTWGSASGGWTVTVTYAGFQGVLALDVQGMGLAPGTL